MTLEQSVDDVHVDDHHARLGEHTAFMWQHNTMTDAVVTVEDKDFPAHKTVLTCYSPYFQRKLIKPGGPVVKHIKLYKMDPEYFRILLEYMYSGDLKICCRNINGVYRTAKRLEMDDATRQCTQILLGDPEDCGNLFCQYVSAKTVGQTDHHLTALGRILSLFEKAVLNKEFLHLNLDELSEIICQDTIGARSEVVIFLACMRWLSTDYPARVPYAMEVLSLVRFPLMSPHEILWCHYPPTMMEIAELKEYQDLIFRALCYSVAREDGVEGCFNQYECSPRAFTGEGEPLILWDFSKMDVNYYSPSELDFWASKIQAGTKGYLDRRNYRRSLARRNEAAVIIQSFWKAYVVKKMYDRWKRVPEIPPGNLSEIDVISVDPFLHTILYHNVKKLTTKEMVHYFPLKDIPQGERLIPKKFERTLLTLGGINPTSSQDELAVGQTVMRYSPSSNLWEKLGTLPLPRHHHCAVYLHGLIYVLGGCDPRLTFRTQMIATSTVFKLDVRTGEWSRAPSMLRARQYHGATVLRGFIYVVGGKNEFGRLLNSVECYDPHQETWWELDPHLCCPRMGAGVAAFGGLLWVAGGFIQPSGDHRVFMVKDVECYNPVHNRWLYGVCYIPRALVFAKLVVCADQLFLIGGCGRDGHSDGDIARSPLHNEALTLLSVNEMLQYNEDTNRWTQVATLPGGRHDVAVASIDNSIYCAGGLSTESFEKSLDGVLRFEVHKSSWESCNSLPLPCVGTAMITLPSLEEIENI